MSFSKITSLYLFTFLLWIGNSAHAEMLIFKTGDKVSYTIIEKSNTEIEFFKATTSSQAEAEIDLDIEILSSSQGSYPFNVEVTLKKMIFSDIWQDEKNTTVMKYNSSTSEGLDDELTKHFGKLINLPLNFTVQKDFQIKETTGLLDQFYDYDFPSTLLELSDTTLWNFEVLLTQLFHLSGEDLLLANSYPVSCYQLITDDLSELDILNQSSAYTINSIDSDKIKASWTGNTKVKDTEGEIKLEHEVSVMGNVTWNLTYPMIQERGLEIETKIDEETIPLHYKSTLQQIWQPKI